MVTISTMSPYQKQTFIGVNGMSVKRQMLTLAPSLTCHHEVAWFGALL